MPRTLAFVLALGIAGAASGVASADASIGAPVAAGSEAATFLQSIYSQYLGKDGKGVPLDSDADIKRWFAPPLARLILRDRELAKKADEVPELDFDPFIGGQDWLVSDLSITVTETGQRATGHVSFKNLDADRKTTVAVSLVKAQGQWRVADIDTPGKSLVAVLKKATAPKAPKHQAAP
jgi:hypothetical protein